MTPKLPIVVGILYISIMVMCIIILIDKLAAFIIGGILGFILGLVFGLLATEKSLKEESMNI